MSNTGHAASLYTRTEGVLLGLGIRSRGQLVRLVDRNSRGYRGLRGIGPTLAKVLQSTREWDCATWAAYFPRLNCDWEQAKEETIE